MRAKQASQGEPGLARSGGASEPGRAALLIVLVVILCLGAMDFATAPQKAPPRTVYPPYIVEPSKASRARRVKSRRVEARAMDPGPDPFINFYGIQHLAVA